jgi:hypothetical protein
MNKKNGFRIDGFKQMTAFFEFVWYGESTVRLTTKHIALYMFILNQCNRSLWPEWLRLPVDTAIQGSCIASTTTYYSTLRDLVKCGLIEWHKGVADKLPAEIKIIDLSVSNNDTHLCIHPDIH